jgi:hypothetical protein
MWRTSAGERVLRGAEWDLVRVALAGLWDEVEGQFHGEAPAFASGIVAFDDLQPAQKLAMLAQAARALHDEATPSPELTAHSEGALAAVFAYAREAARDEIAVGESVYWRRLILAACREADADPDDVLPGADCLDVGEWDLLLECLGERIFWDADYEMGDAFLDADPREARAKQEEMGIPEHYYLAEAPDPADDELPGVRRELCSLLGTNANRLLPALEDTYHGIIVGPCDPAAAVSCRLLRAFWIAGSDSFDVAYGDWEKLFRRNVLRAAAEPPAAVPEPASVLSVEQRIACEHARVRNTALDLGGGHRTEPCNGGWIVVDGHDSFLAGIENAAWTCDRDDESFPALRFAGPQEAWAALMRSEAAATARARRRKSALRLLQRLRD